MNIYWIFKLLFSIVLVFLNYQFYSYSSKLTKDDILLKKQLVQTMEKTAKVLQESAFSSLTEKSKKGHTEPIILAFEEAQCTVYDLYEKYILMIKNSNSKLFENDLKKAIESLKAELLQHLDSFVTKSVWRNGQGIIGIEDKSHYERRLLASLNQTLSNLDSLCKALNVLMLEKSRLDYINFIGASLGCCRIKYFLIDTKIFLDRPIKINQPSQMRFGILSHLPIENYQYTSLYVNNHLQTWTSDYTSKITLWPTQKGWNHFTVKIDGAEGIDTSIIKEFSYWAD